MTVKKIKKMPSEKSLKNLIPMSKRSLEDQRKLREMAAKARTEQAWEERMLQKCLQMALLKTNPSTGNKYVVDVAAAIVLKACNEGDAKEFNAIRDLLGEKPVDKTEDVTDVSDILARARVRSKVAEDENQDN